MEKFDKILVRDFRGKKSKKKWNSRDQARIEFITLGASVELDPIARPWHSWTHERRHEEKVSKAGSEVGHDFDRSQGPYSQATLLLLLLLVSFHRFDFVSIDAACLPGLEIKRRLSPYAIRLPTRGHRFLELRAKNLGNRRWSCQTSIDRPSILKRDRNAVNGKKFWRTRKDRSK